MILEVPKTVTQASQNTCWAAALESWTGMTATVATPQAGLISVYATLAAGGLTPSSLKTLASDFRLDFDKAFLNTSMALAPDHYPFPESKPFCRESSNSR